MPLSEDLLMSRNHQVYFCTTTMVQQWLKCGVTVRKSSELTDSPFVHLLANLRQYGMDKQEVGMTEELQLRSANVSNRGVVGPLGPALVMRRRPEQGLQNRQMVRKIGMRMT
jgi:hypothetical protein